MRCHVAAQARSALHCLFKRCECAARTSACSELQHGGCAVGALCAIMSGQAGLPASVLGLQAAHKPSACFVSTHTAGSVPGGRPRWQGDQGPGPPGEQAGSCLAVGSPDSKPAFAAEHPGQLVLADNNPSSKPVSAPGQSSWQSGVHALLWPQHGAALHPDKSNPPGFATHTLQAEDEIEAL